MTFGRRSVFVALLSLIPLAAARPQALTPLISLSVGYGTAKATAKPEGALKVTIDSIDMALMAASRQGRTGEMRRLYAKGVTLLAGREWTDVTDYTSSLVLRTDQIVVDPETPLVVRLEQIYAPSIALALGLSAKIVLRTAPGGRGGPPQTMVKDLGTSEGVARDLRESPHAMELDLRGVKDGTYQLSVEVIAPAGSLGSANLSVHVHEGLAGAVARLEADAKKAPEALQAEIQFPVDRMRRVNRGDLELRTFDADRDFAAADSIAVAVKAGKNPFIGKTGDFKRHYTLESAREILPYRVYVPSTYTPNRSYPLIIGLHGLGGTEDALLSGYQGAFGRLAEDRGYVFVSPMGYRTDGFYGWGPGDPPADPVSRRRRQLSEEDVMQVLALARRQFNVDTTRIYLMGHSMGSLGTWQIAKKYPDVWAAVAGFAGGGAADMERMRALPSFVVHGDADATVSVTTSRTMVARMKELGMNVQYIEVPGGSHSGVVPPNVPAMFDFFDAHRKK